MTWTRLDDGWSDRPILEQLSYEVRWHYLALIQFCSRTSRYDGVVRSSDARRCSDVADPAAAVAELVNVGLLVAVADGLKLVQIGEHVPPPHQRDAARKEGQRERKRRERLHKDGDHSECLPEHCEVAMSHVVTGDVTRDPGTGRDRTGPGQDAAREGTTDPPFERDNDPWSEQVAPPGSLSSRFAPDLSADTSWSDAHYAAER